ncbi:hypothetical protein ACHAQH_002368 [Verticillium albo-atrum]
MFTGCQFSRSLTLPMRIEIDWNASVGKWLEYLRTRVTAMETGWGGSTCGEAYETSVPEARDSCWFRTALLIRSHDEFSLAEGELEYHRPLQDYYVLPSHGLALAVECIQKGPYSIIIRIHMDDAMTETKQAEQICFQLENILRQLDQIDSQDCSLQGRKELRICDLDYLCEEDKALLWSWNSGIPRTIKATIHDLFAEQALRTPHLPAVHAWDGSLSYSELNCKSTLLAAWLLKMEIAQPCRIIPVCFEKTIWTTVVILAIAKAGSAFVMLDPNLPRGRLSSIMKQLGASFILVRPDTVDLAQSIADQTWIIDEDLFEPSSECLTRSSNHLMREVSPSDPLYVVFTSGSTGTPKGFTISHANLSSGVTHQARALGFAGRRTLDSSAYSFDAYIFNTFHTLVTGGCLCVPSETDRINNLQHVLQGMMVDFVQLTPSVSRLLDPTKLPLLRTLILTGERITRTVLEPWLAANVQVINVYGPSECTILCAANKRISCARDADSIGFGLGANLWIADVHDINKLAPIGAVGELLIEGPIVGQGYLGEDHGTSGFMIGASDQSRVSKAMPFPNDRLFRTRDLARLNADGSVVFLGRGDTQIKINGQRVEIGEIEYHLTQHFPDSIRLVVEPIQLPSGSKQLFAFVCLGELDEETAMRIRLEELTKGLERKLSDFLPKYMIPSAYFPLRSIPMTATGKTDLKAIKQMLSEHPHLTVDGFPSAPTLNHIQDSGEALTDEERTMQSLWADALEMDKSSILVTDNFFSKGDSLAAMRLVSAARSKGYRGITVADILRHPRFSDLARFLEADTIVSCQPRQHLDEAPFSLLKGSPEQINALTNTVAEICRCAASDIEDLYPCSPIQQEMMGLAARRPGDFTTQKVFTLTPDIELSRFKSAWENVVSAIPILRTRLVDVTAASVVSSTLLQAVIKGTLPWSRYTSLQECLRCERDKNMGLGDLLFRVALAQPSCEADGSDSTIHAVVSMHHAVYDGWFLNLVSAELDREYSGQGGPGLSPYRDFIKLLEDSDLAAQAASFWKVSLKDVDLHLFPPFPHLEYRPSAAAKLERQISGITWASSLGAAPNTLVQTAWGMVLSKYSGACDVVFGATLLGRQSPMDNIEQVAGPTIASVPIRILIDWQQQTAAQLLQSVQDHSAQMIRHAHLGIDNIRRLNFDTEMACQLRTFLVVQPEHRAAAQGSCFDFGTDGDDIHVFNTYALMLECSISPDSFGLLASFDEEVVSRDQVDTMLSCLGRILDFLCTAEMSDRLWDMPALTDVERQRILSFRSSKNQQHQVREVDIGLRQSLAPEMLESAVEIVDLLDESRQLVAFICPQKQTPQHEIRNILAQISQQLTDRFPRHLIPVKFLLLESIPKIASGERDEAALRQLALGAAKESFLNILPTSGQPRPSDERYCDDEIVLQRLWADTLHIDPNTIKRTSSFIFLGGDSIAAMRLTSAARDEGFTLTVADIFRCPRLADMAAAVSKQLDVRASASLVVQPFSLLPRAIDMMSLARACDIEPNEIDDVYPCSPTQELMMARSARQAGDYVSHHLVPLSKEIDVERLRVAWERVASDIAILRTRIVEDPLHGLVQVLVRAPVPWSVHHHLDTLRRIPVGLGQSLLRLYCIEQCAEADGPAFLMTMHHAIYDRWSASLVLHAVELAYVGTESIERPINYNIFIKYLLQDMDQAAAKKFWMEYLEGATTPSFPSLPSSRYEPRATQTHKLNVQDMRWPKGVTPATVLRAAWALMSSQYSSSDDIVFGSIVMGRNAPFPSPELLAGPTIATVPVRVCLDWAAMSPLGLMQSIQAHAAEMIPFEHYGLDRLRSLSPDADLASRFQSLLVVQPPQSPPAEGRVFGPQRIDEEYQAVSMYALVLEATPGTVAGDVSLHLSFDDQVVDSIQARRMLLQLERVLRQLCTAPETEDTKLRDLDLLAEQDRQQIMLWNAQVPPVVDSRVDFILAERAGEVPDAPAICAWDGNLSYRELFDTAKRLARRLVVQHDVTPGAAVPICCSKSVWTPVAMLGVIMAGGVAVTMDPFQPIERLRSVTSQVVANLILATPSTEAMAQQLVTNVFVLNDASITALASDSESDNSWVPNLSGASAAYITFTSGTTGVPKGAVMTHANCCSALVHQATHLGIGATTRALDLGSYSFDIVWEEFLHVLHAGACLCVPHDDDRRNDIVGAIKRLKVNYLHSTPSLIRTIDPSSVPEIRKVVFGGETLGDADVARWIEHVDEIRNLYGPSECTIVSTVAVHGSDFTTKPNLGRACGLNAWVTSCHSPDKLAPIGAVGELVLEGPLVGQGYINEPAKTAAVFMSCRPSDWLPDATIWQEAGKCTARARLYRTGDLVKYDGQGRLHPMGRKDTQVKIRGQRMELEEVETHARQFLSLATSVAAEVIELANRPSTGTDKAQVLMMFLSKDLENHSSPDESQVGTTSSKAQSEFDSGLVSDLTRHLSQALPRYMVPTAFIFLDRLPLSPTGKLDRKRLRNIGTQAKVDEIRTRRPGVEPTTELEKRLRDGWAEVLGVDPDTIGRDDNFFDIGGDSLTALRLVGVARNRSLPLSVSLIFHHPRLDAMAEHINAADHAGPAIARTDVRVSGNDGFREKSNAKHVGHTTLTNSDASKTMNIPEVNIADITPVTEFQHYAITCAFAQPRTEWNYFRMDLGQLIDVPRLAETCRHLSRLVGILRCVFIPHQDTYAQVVLRDLEVPVDIISVSRLQDDPCDAVCRRDVDEKILPGMSFCKFFIFHHEEHHETSLVMRISHAQYDGLSLHQLIECLATSYDNRPASRVSEFSTYINQVSMRTSEDYAYWRKLLKGCEPPITLSSSGVVGMSSPGRRMCVRKDIKSDHLSGGITVATLFSAAWGLALSTVTGSPEVVFGRAVSGRASASSTQTHDAVIGPCLNIVPARVRRPTTDDAIHSELKALQVQFVESIPHEAMGFGEILSHCTEWAAGTSLGTVFYFQDIEHAPSFSLGGNRAKMVAMRGIQGAEPPEPPRMNVYPAGDGHFGLELLVSENVCNIGTVEDLVDEMARWLQLLGTCRTRGD